MRKPIDLSFYLVLDPDLCGGFEGMVQTSLVAAQNGATVVQLRAPLWKKRELVECGRAIKAVLDPMNVPLIINDHADVCLVVGAAGLHVGQKDLAPVDARAVIGPDKVLGLSVSNIEELRSVDTALVDHLGIGPVFATATKKDAAPALGLEGFKELARQKPCPVVAIGSVKAQLAKDLIASGADGLAVVSAVCGQPDVAFACRNLKHAIDAARRAL